MTSTIIVFIVIGVTVCVWLLYAAPAFQEKERQVRSENAALVKDIADIEAMNGDMTELEGWITDTEKAIDTKYASRAVTARDAAALIEAICAEAGYRASSIAVAQETLLHPAGTLTPALYSVDITFLIEDKGEAGAAIIRGLERSAAADFEVKSFVYRVTPPEDDEAAYYGEWIFTVTLNYYD